MSTGVIHSLNSTSYASFSPMSSSNKFKNLSYAECEHIWSYGGKLNLLLRNFLNAAARSPMVVFFVGKASSCTMKTLVTRLKLLSIVSVPFSLVDITSISQKMGKSFSINDKEGLLMSSLSLTMTASDALDSFSTFTNSLLTVSSGDPIQLFSLIGLPLGFIIAGTGTVSRTIHVAKGLNLYKNIQPESFLKEKNVDKAILKKELEEKLGIDEVQKLINSLASKEMDPTNLKKIEQLNEKKKASILRSIPKDAMPAFERLFAMFDVQDSSVFTDQELEEVFNNLRNIRMHLEKKMRVDSVGILANFIVISALVLFSMGIVNAQPFLLMATAFTIRLISLAYQDQKIQFTDKIKGVL